ncbi:MAG: poly-gamma-glutamate synthase PgsB [Clostridia bacterium]
MTLILILCLCLLVAGAGEWAIHRRMLARIPLRILVNGTRGKTSVTRLMAGALRASGKVTYAKSTGTEAMVILPDGAQDPLLRKRGVRLTEQIPFIRRAVRGNAQAVVVECMAVQPESQKMMAEKLVCPTLVLMTNARVDHVAEMGGTIPETIRALAFSIPKGADVITPELGFQAYIAPGKLIVPDASPLEEGALDGFDYPVFEDNIRLVLAACDYLGIDHACAMRGMRTALPDIGMAGPFFAGETVIINAFAANDCNSSTQLFEDSCEALSLNGYPVQVLYNNRSDREYRLREFVPLMKKLAQGGATLSAIGESPSKVLAYYRRKAGLACAPVRDASELVGPRRVILCLGNIKGAGKVFIEQLQAREGA